MWKAGGVAQGPSAPLTASSGPWAQNQAMASEEILAEVNPDEDARAWAEAGGSGTKH